MKMGQKSGQDLQILGQDSKKNWGQDLKARGTQWMVGWTMDGKSPWQKANLVRKKKELCYW